MSPSAPESSANDPTIPAAERSPVAPLGATDAMLSAAPRGDLIALVGTTTRVFDDCLLPNGALVEAPGHLSFYPSAARDAMRCRPGRDLALAIAAMDALGRDVRAPLLRWLGERAAGFGDDALLRRAYAVHGPVLDERHDLVGTGLLLRAISADPAAALAEPASAVTRSLASALAVRWDGHGFRDHDRPDPLAHAAELAAAEVGLRAAGAAQGVDEWSRVADAIARTRADAAKATLAGADRLDSTRHRDSLVEDALTLAWPLGAPAGDVVAFATLVERAERAVGLHDLEWQEDGADEPRRTLHRGTGLRPAELFWLALALAAAGRVGDAERYYTLGCELADNDGHFPETADSPDLEPAARPLLAAHLTFLLAADALGRIAEIPKTGHTATRRR